ncbi:MAG TPA: tripartite tricarboxylate transporter substrate binding protein [Bryobacteraceae bacterium]|nr:tripartite tricarboxylate transporter substrate binding protein [Bryobacteraceae bacterium]
MKRFAAHGMDLIVCAFAVAVSQFVPSSANAAYPERPIRLIVPSAAGGGPDIGSRLIAAELTKQMGQNVVVENRAGASGVIGTEAIVRATPDGYTFGQGNFNSMNANRIVMAKLPYNPDKDLQPIVFAYMSRNMLAVNRALPVNSVSDLIAHAKANPGKLMYGSVGVGSSMHFSGALFCLLTSVDMRHVPYKGAPAAITDIIGGQIHMMFDNIQSISPHVAAGRLRGLAVTTAKRADSHPDLPTVGETIPGFEIAPWAGYIVPAGVPRPIVQRLNAELNKALTVPAVRDKLIGMGLDPRGGTPEEFAQFIKKEVAKWSDVAKRANVRME